MIESVGLSVGSASAAVPPEIAGPSITQQLTQIAGTFNNLEYDTVAINPADVSGQIVLRMSFDDATDTLTSSFSLDGGATFSSPFPSIQVFRGVSEYEMLLGAGAFDAPGVPTPTRTPTPTATPTPPPTPQPVGLKMLSIRNPSGQAARKVIYKVKDFGHALAGSPLGSGATFNLKLDAASQCFPLPAAGWSALGSKGFKYSDNGGLYGPVKIARIKKSGSTFTIKIILSGRQGLISVIPPNPGAQADTNLSFGGGAKYCSSTAGVQSVPTPTRRSDVQSQGRAAAAVVQRPGVPAVARCAPPVVPNTRFPISGNAAGKRFSHPL